MQLRKMTQLADDRSSGTLQRRDNSPTSGALRLEHSREFTMFLRQAAHAIARHHVELVVRSLAANT
jgi:hypothetical protein